MSRDRCGRWRLRLALMAALAGAAPWALAQRPAAAATAAPTALDCASEAFQTVLVPAEAGPAAAPDRGIGAAPDSGPAAAPAATAAGAASAVAQAVWLDARRLRWPQVQASDAPVRWRLYHAAHGGLRAEPGQRVRGGDGFVPLRLAGRPLPPEVAARTRHVGAGVELKLSAADAPRLPAMLRGQTLLVQEDAQGRVQRATAVQHALALDALYAAAEQGPALGATVQGAGGPQPAVVGGPQAAVAGGRAARARTVFRLWAPTAQRVALCVDGPGAAAPHGAPAGVARPRPMRRDARSGTWQLALPGDRSGQRYRYLVDVVVPGAGLVRNRVTDPYALALTADSKRSVVAALDSPALKPPGWDAHATPATVAAPTDLVIYELHLRDFSVSDDRVRPAYRGKYLAFTEPASRGMAHLRALAAAGLTDVHLLPVFDIATIPEQGCTTPDAAGLARHGPASEAQQAIVMAGAAGDCYNWGYDPLHYTTPEGSYASDAADPARRIVEFRRMVQALHEAGLRVGMDVVYNHTAASGQHPLSVLDRIVPGYYHRLDAAGAVERSTCCANTATEHRMMARLMSDSVLTWARDYRIDSFRFDLMGHQPRAAMVALKARLERELGRAVPLIGEGWDFGEVAQGARFVQAAQRSLAGSGIGSFSDRARDAVRGRGGPHEQGWANGLVFDPHPQAAPHTPADLRHAADLVRVGLAGTLRDFVLHTADDQRLPLARIAYGDQPAGYAAEPSEVVNYVENHDNATLFDHHVTRLPPGTPAMEHARVQVLALATTAFSQGIAYFHAGVDLLRSKSMDGNSFDSGDWFNRIDWSGQDNGFGSGLPPREANGEQWPVFAPLLAGATIKPGPAEIAFTRDAFRDLLRIRASSTLFRLRSAEEIGRRLHFHNTGSTQEPTVIALQLDGTGLPGAGFAELLVFLNADRQAHTLSIPALAGRRYTLHPVHLAREAADRRIAAEARAEPEGARFTLPARSAVVFVRR